MIKSYRTWHELQKRRSRVDLIDFVYNFTRMEW